jgi:hypothetical protein
MLQGGSGAKRRQWMGCGGLRGVAGMSITSYYGSFPHSLVSKTDSTAEVKLTLFDSKTTQPSMGSLSKAS